MAVNAVILSTGTELTTGRVVDTNSTVIAERLTAGGILVRAVLKVGDDRGQLLWALRRACELADVVIGTGGLGPTPDDLTTSVVAEFLGRDLSQDEAVAQALRHRFQARGLPWSDNNLKQAQFPAGSTILPNPAGTAPGFFVETTPGKWLFWLSGVPEEMTAMLQESVIPTLRRLFGPFPKISACTFKIHGLTEAKLDELLQAIALPPEASLSFRAHYPDLSVQLTVRGPDPVSVLENLRGRVRERLGSCIYGEGDVTLEEVVGELLSRKGLTLALAESCTGGLISHRITRVPGSSAYFLGAAVTYSNAAKEIYLGVNRATLERYGAVSRETALEMSSGVRERTRSDIGLSVTGIAGPTGGTDEKPVGTVWISISHRRHEARRYRLYGDRECILAGTAQAALNWLRLILLESDDPRK